MPGRIDARLLRPSEREEALAHLGRNPKQNLFLIDLTARLGTSNAPGEMPTEIICARRGGQVVGVAALRPSVVFDSAFSADMLEAAFPYLESLGVGLVKSAKPIVDLLWARMGKRRARNPVVDRLETAYALHQADFDALLSRPAVDPGRIALPPDLEQLVVAARESLREENRPDPFAGDVRGFRRWVSGRVARARVVETNGELQFVGYADVQREEGWLIQGVYTWRAARRRGYATAGMLDLCHEAFAAGADHVQLAVIEGNDAARGLYEALGFRPFGQLRTILFT